MSLAILFRFLCAQHVSDINISIIRSLRLCCWITTSVVVFSVRRVLEIWCGWVGVVSVLQTSTQPHQISNTRRTDNTTTDVVIQQQSRKLLIMDILMSETCWAHKKWNKIARDIKLVFHSSTITMMHGPINIKLHSSWKYKLYNYNWTNRKHGEFNNECISAHLIPALMYFHGLSIIIIQTTTIILFPNCWSNNSLFCLQGSWRTEPPILTVSQTRKTKQHISL